MPQKATKITGWVLTIILSLFFIMTGLFKAIGNEKIIAQTAAIGIDAHATLTLGLIEILAALLFVLPRTGVVGALLLIAYMGGVIATALQHHQPMMMFVVIQALIWVAGLLRFPELGQRLFSPNLPTKPLN